MHTPHDREQALYSLELLKEFSRGKEEFVTQMIRIFKEEMPKSIALLNNYYSEFNYQKISDTAHKMRTSIDMFDIKTIKNDIRLVENFSREQKNLDLLPELINRIVTTCELVILNL